MAGPACTGAMIPSNEYLSQTFGRFNLAINAVESKPRSTHLLVKPLNVVVFLADNVPSLSGISHSTVPKSLSEYRVILEKYKKFQSNPSNKTYCEDSSKYKPLTKANLLGNLGPSVTKNKAVTNVSQDNRNRRSLSNIFFASHMIMSPYR